MRVVLVLMVLTCGMYPGRQEQRPCEQEAWAIDQQEGPQLSMKQIDEYDEYTVLIYQKQDDDDDLTRPRSTCSRSQLLLRPTSGRKHRPLW